ncbi:MAG TPA: AtpZ/AtpI family protein [Blastocatellia bacterium]|nr:AtpZ/AtpI family protein [Blastocatellia bacterium]
MPEDNSDQSSGSRSWTQATQLIGIAFSIPWTLLATTLLGNYMDKKFGTQPWLMLAGLFGGLIGAFFEGAVLVRRMGK